MKESEMLWASQHCWYRSSRNVRAYKEGEWWEVTVYDSERDCDVQFDHFKALEKWAQKQQ